MNRRVLSSLTFLLVLLAGCATAPPDTTPGGPAAPVPTQWHAPLPHDQAHGGDVADLRHWWSQFDDPLLPQLIGAAQQASATLAQATARIADALAARVAAGAALLPAVDLAASAGRGIQGVGEPIGTTASVGLQAAWELDLFGAGRAGRSAAQARLESSQAGWHDARVSVAAEVATAYLGLRACEAQVAQAELDVQSRAETARLTALSAAAGFQAPAAADLARASAAQGKASLTQQRGQCDLAVKALVALTAVDEPELRRQLAESTARLPQPVALRVVAVPAAALAQRPDVAAAARELVAASADADQAEALRRPRIALTGSIGAASLRSGGIRTDGNVWSLGPVVVTLPLFDGGVRRASAEAARARHASARVAYASRLRIAVREVESALVTLHSATVRGDDALAAVSGFERSYQAVEARQRGGLASLFELEDARRSMVAARSALIEQRRESVLAWVDTYRALGGGWSPSAQAADTTTR